MPVNYRNYPSDWKTKIRPAILARAKDRCEWCAVENHRYIQRLKTDKSQYRYNSASECSIWHSSIRTILTIAHIDHDVENNDPTNLAALCQRCHLVHDKEFHAINRRKNRLK